MNKNKKNSNYENVRKYRRIQKDLGIRFHTDESKPGETFTEFRKRIKSEKHGLF